MTVRERFLALDANTRKMVVLGVAIAAAVTFLMMPSLSSLLPVATSRGQSRKEPPDAPGTVGGPGATARLMLGAWHGQAVIPRGLCTLDLEIRNTQAGLAGYTTLMCIPLRPGVGVAASPAGAAMLGRLYPTSAILSNGASENGAIRFTVQKNIGVTAAGTPCAMRKFTASMFGDSAIAGEWEDPVCGDGQIIMRKVRQ